MDLTDVLSAGGAAGRRVFTRFADFAAGGVEALLFAFGTLGADSPLAIALSSAALLTFFLLGFSACFTGAPLRALPGKGRRAAAGGGVAAGCAVDVVAAVVFVVAAGGLGGADLRATVVPGTARESVST